MTHTSQPSHAAGLTAANRRAATTTMAPLIGVLLCCARRCLVLPRRWQDRLQYLCYSRLSEEEQAGRTGGSSRPNKPPVPTLTGTELLRSATYPARGAETEQPVGEQEAAVVLSQPDVDELQEWKQPKFWQCKAADGLALMARSIWRTGLVVPAMASTACPPLRPEQVCEIKSVVLRHYHVVRRTVSKLSLQQELQAGFDTFRICWPGSFDMRSVPALEELPCLSKQGAPWMNLVSHLDPYQNALSLALGGVSLLDGVFTESPVHKLAC